MLEQRAGRGVPARCRRASGRDRRAARARRVARSSRRRQRLHARRDGGRRAARAASVTTPSSARPAATASWIRAHDSRTRPPKTGSVDAADHASRSPPGRAAPPGHRSGGGRRRRRRARTPRGPRRSIGCMRPRLRHAGRKPYRRTAPGGLPACTGVEQRHVATHVLLTRRRRVDDAARAAGPAATGRDSDIEAHVDDVAVAHHVVASLEPLLAALTHHRIGTGVEQLLGIGDLGADETARDVGVDARGRVERGLALAQSSMRGPRCPRR